MLTKGWQRLVRECLIRIYRDERTRHALHFPVYYFAYHGDVKTLGLAVQSLQQIPQIPWPDKQCIILAESAPASIMYPGLKSLTWIIHNENHQTLSVHPECSDFAHCGATFLIEGQVYQTKPRIYFLVHQEAIENGIVPSQKTALLAAKDIADKSAEAWGSGRQEADTEAYADYLSRTCVWGSRSRWVAFDLPDKDPQAGLAADFLAYLSNLAIPCHYMVKTRFKQGFGPTGEMKRLTAAKPIFSIVNFERLHKVYAKTGAETGIELDPHFRRGHIRHFWKEAGLDRLVLPVAHSERMLLVHRRQVRRRYIQPQWIGDPEFSSDGCDFEIVTKDMPLPLL